MDSLPLADMGAWRFYRSPHPSLVLPNSAARRKHKDTFGALRSFSLCVNENLPALKRDRQTSNWIDAHTVYELIMYIFSDIYLLFVQHYDANTQRLLFETELIKSTDCISAHLAGTWWREGAPQGCDGE